MNRFFKFFRKFCVVIFMFFIIIYYLLLQEKKNDLSNKTEFKKWVGTIFEIKQDAFLYKQHEDWHFHLGVSREEICLPESTEDYLDDYNRWSSEPDYVWHKDSFQAIHLIPSGTQFKITGIYQFEKPLVGDYLAIEVMILDGPYKGRHAQAQGLFRYHVVPYGILGPKASLSRVEMQEFTHVKI